MFLDKGSEFICPTCQKGLLIFRDYCKRIIRYEGGKHEWIKIPRHQCDNPKCKKIHRMLPDTMLPYKHYLEETITGVLDEIVGPDDMDSEAYPSEKSMSRWHHWFIFNRMNIDRHLKSINHRILEYGEELLFSKMSLLDYIRSSQLNDWLKIIICYIYNSGNTLQAFY